MIRGAVEIFGEIPAVYLNPFLVAESQEEAMRGFIVVAYLPQEALKRYDLLFLRGPEIYECISLDEVRRAPTNMDAAHCRFKNQVQRHRTLIYLFEAGESLTQHFISTVYTEPIIKVKVDTLSKQQIQRLLRSSGCARPLAERIDFSRKLPAVEIREIDPLVGLEFQLGFKQGGFLLYDMADMAVHPAATGAAEPTAQTELAFEPTHSDGPGQAVREDPGQRENREPAQQANENPAQRANGDPAQRAHEEASQRATQGPVPGAGREPVDDAAQKPGRSAARNPERSRRKPRGKRSKPALASLSETPVEPHQDTPADSKADGPEAWNPDAPQTPGRQPATTYPEHDEQEFVRVLDRLYRSFRQHTCGCVGRKSESIIAKSERRLQLLNPEFSTGSLDESTAPLVLDLIDDVIRHAPWLKRSKLRSAALTLVADLFTKQYELLERHKAVDKVEQIYYRMKK